jgi:hypothetical protein
MIQFAQSFPDEAIVVTLSQQLSWSHFHAVLPIKDPLARDFYAEMCRIERWDVRTLRLKIGGMLFQRTALSKKPQAVISAEIGKLRDGQMGPDTVFRDPYLLDLLGLKGAHSDRDLDAEQVELLQLDAKSIRVSEYLTALPPLRLLRERLHHAIEHAREQAARRLPNPQGRQ